MKSTAFHLNLLMESERVSSSPVRFRVMLPVLSMLARRLHERPLVGRSRRGLFEDGEPCGPDVPPPGPLPRERAGHGRARVASRRHPFRRRLPRDRARVGLRAERLGAPQRARQRLGVDGRHGLEPTDGAAAGRRAPRGRTGWFLLEPAEGRDVRVAHLLPSVAEGPRRRLPRPRRGLKTSR